MSFTIDPLGDNIILRNPDFGDNIRVAANDIRRYTRGGVLKTTVDSGWPVLTTHVYAFSIIKNTVADDLIDQLRTFLDDNAGLEIRIIDHLGTTLDGFITSPINEIVSVRPDCTYSIGFEFMEKPA